MISNPTTLIFLNVLVAVHRQVNRWLTCMLSIILLAGGGLRVNECCIVGSCHFTPTIETIKVDSCELRQDIAVSCGRRPHAQLL